MNITNSASSATRAWSPIGEASPRGQNAAKRSGRLIRRHSTESPSAPPSELWTTGETAAYLGVHERTVRRLVARDGLPCVRVGSRLRFDPSDVLRWVAARKEGS
jgi:excisionase family DNA binding protein